MGGIGMLMNIGRTALEAQSHGMDVTAHNIANVNTPGYSRQSPVYGVQDPQLYGGVYLGRGVQTTEILRDSDQYLENRLMRQRSDLMSSNEMDSYLRILEGFFDETSETGLSVMLSEFWNIWYDISNNPAGSPERIALYEHSLLLCDQLNGLYTDLLDLQTDLTSAVGSGLETVNRILGEIAEMNTQILGTSTGPTANDLLDKRNQLLTELSEYIDVKSFKQEDGTLTVVGPRGCVLVQNDASYPLRLGGDQSDRILWENSQGGSVDITDHIASGKLCGWLDIRDEIVEKYKLDLDALMESLVWTVNRQHSQGVGLEGFSSVTGSYAAKSNPGAALGSAASGLDFWDKITDGTFKIWVYDSSGNAVENTIDIDADGTTLLNLCDTINGPGIANLTASITENKLVITADSEYTFAFSDDTSNTLAALGINTFFTGAPSNDIGVHESIQAQPGLIAAALINTDGSFSTGDNRNALSVLELQNASLPISRWTCDRIEGDTESTVTSTIEAYYSSMVGELGITSSSIARARLFHQDMVDNLTQIRDSVSAVSLDEEMTNLIRYQHAYAAAAKLISASDEMLEVLLSMK